MTQLAVENKDLVEIAFETFTILDKRSFTTFGLHAKPGNPSPIGFFGTGLKYAIAILVRENIPVTIWIGYSSYEFYQKKSEFRGQEIVEIKCRMRKRKKASDLNAHVKPTYFKLPYTVDLGTTWELWKAYRELASNTIDEEGLIIHRNYSHYKGGMKKSERNKARKELLGPNKTVIIVEGNDFAQVYHNRDEIFLPEATRSEHQIDADSENPNSTPTPDIEVFDEPSRYMYYRGIRVLDLNDGNYASDAHDNPVRSRYTWNLVGKTELTEDRTLAYPYGTLSRIGRFILRSRDRDFIRQILEVDETKFWEGKIDFDHPSTTPTSEFMEVYNDVAKPLSGAKSYMKAYHTPKPPEVQVDRLDISTVIDRLSSIRYGTYEPPSEHEMKLLCKDAVHYLTKYRSELRAKDKDIDIPF